LYFSEVDWDTDLKGALRIFLENKKKYVFSEMNTTLDKYA